MRRFSFLESLRCLDCQAHHEPTYTLECPLFGGLLDPRYDLDSVCRVGAANELFRGPEHVISLGKGDTPLLEARWLESRLGIPKLLLNYEGSLPTGTVKDRTSATAVS